MMGNQKKAGYLVSLFLEVPPEDKDNALEFANQVCIDSTNATALEFDCQRLELNELGKFGKRIKSAITKESRRIQ